MTMKTRHSKPLGCNKSSSKKEVYSNTILPQDTRKTSNREPNFIHKTNTDIKGEIYINIITVRNFNITLTTMG